MTIITSRTFNITITWFKRPGIASIFIPNSGTAQECKTSSEVTIKRKVVLAGNTKILSTVNKRYHLDLNHYLES